MAAASIFHAAMLIAFFWYDCAFGSRTKKFSFPMFPILLFARRASLVASRTTPGLFFMSFQKINEISKPFA